MSKQASITSFLSPETRIKSPRRTPKTLPEPARKRKFSENVDSTPKIKRRSAKFAKLDNDPSQQILDAGQKRFGAEFCRECGMYFNPIHREDAELHEAYHAQKLALQGGENLKRNIPAVFELKSQNWLSWKRELAGDCLQDFLDGAIYKLVGSSASANSSTSIRERIEAVFDFVNSDLGFSGPKSLWKRGRKVLVFVSSRQKRKTISGDPDKFSCSGTIFAINQSGSPLRRWVRIH